MPCPVPPRETRLQSDLLHRITALHAGEGRTATSNLCQMVEASRYNLRYAKHMCNLTGYVGE